MELDYNGMSCLRRRSSYIKLLAAGLACVSVGVLLSQNLGVLYLDVSLSHNTSATLVDSLHSNSSQYHKYDNAYQELLGSTLQRSPPPGQCYTTALNEAIGQLKGQTEVIVAGLSGKMLTPDEKMRDQLLSLVENKCYNFVSAGVLRRPIITYIMGVPSSRVSEEVVTLVTQLGFDRFDRLQLTLENWKGAVSATVYIPVEEIPRFVEFLCGCPQIQGRTNVGIHLLLQNGVYYPINLLRNIALNQTSTHLVYLTDVDFIPSPDTEMAITNLWNHNSSFFDKNVAVIPAFEANSEIVPPQTKQELITLWNEEKIYPARFFNWKRGHMPSNYRKWKTTSSLYPIRYSVDYEPYIVMRTDLTPQYSNWFVERFKDKAQQLMEVWARGFTFQGLGSTFSLHFPHKQSVKSSEKSLYTCALKMNDLFIKELKRKYNISTIPAFR